MRPVISRTRKQQKIGLNPQEINDVNVAHNATIAIAPRGVCGIPASLWIARRTSADVATT